MGRYQAYPEYKDSGVEWLGDVPINWVMTKIVWNFRAEKGKNGQILTKEYCGENAGDYPVYSGQTENEGVMGRINIFEFDKGSSGVLFSTTVGAKAMHLSHLIGKFSLSQNCMIISVTSKHVDTRFAFYHFQPLFAFERSLIPEHMQASFRMEDLYSYSICLPSLDEQQKIANFLDHETAKIDTLIEKQQQLIQLLKEKRQAVISHAVTKGLNPNAPMKDSGVEWLGEVPEHWGVIPLKLIVKTRKGVAFKSDDFIGEGTRVVKASDIKQLSINSSEVYLPTEFQKVYPKAILKKGDIILSTVGSTPDVKNSAVGQIGMLPDDLDGSLLNQNTVVFDLANESINRMYLFYLLLSQAYRDHLDLNAHGTANQASLNISDMLDFLCPVPPKLEQDQIANNISTTLSRLDRLEVSAINAIQLMQERRTALISAAVTGKIDVRLYASHPAGGLQPSKPPILGNL